jgi:cytochrome c peroxidase
LDGFFNQQDKFSTFGDGHHRISSLGTGSGAWAAYPGTSLDFAFPVTGRSNKQTLLVKTMGNNVVYGEADMNDFMDGHYLLYLPFNQMVEFCPHVDGCAKTGLYRTFRYSAGVTPDTSGSFHKAVMNEGSTFSMGENYVPYSEARNTLSNDFQGRAIEFKKGGLVTVAIPSESQLSKPQQNYTIQFAIKPLTLLTATESVRIARKRQSWEISLVGMNHFRLSGAANNTSFSKDIPISLPQGLWSHVTVEFIPILQSGLYTLGINVYVNGTRYLPNSDQPQSFVLELERTRTRHSLTANTNPIEIGPGTSRTSLSGTIYALDEFAISKARRTQSEIELAAHLLPDRSAFISNLTSVAGNPLPLGLKPEDLRIPAQLGPYVNNLDAIHLGQQLFSDPKLSASQEMSCATCHQPDKFFTDGLTTPKNGDRNTPTTANRAFSTLQFFNGRSPNLVEQALQPILNPNEMNADLNTVISYLRNDPEINQGFQKVFGKNKVVTPHRLARVLAAYEVSLLAGNSLVDNLSSSNKQTQVTTQIAKGRLIFQGKGRCVGCHSGSNYSDELFHNTGTEQSTPNGSILRRFKTPTLRNIALTGPYFHDGSKATLDDVIQFYNQGGNSTSPELVPLGLNREEQHALKEFLQALTSE